MMRETDQNLQDLTPLLGDAVADYRALRHRGALPAAPMRRPLRQRVGLYAVAASVLLAVAVVALGALDPGMRADNPMRFAMPRAAAAPLTLRPAGTLAVQPGLKRSRLSVSTALPGPPSRPRG